METKRKRKQINPYLMVILSFLLVILVGSFLINMPFSQQSGTWGNYMDSLVTAVSATCVTGVATYGEGVACTLTFGGQLVTLILIQIGGLGFITLLTFVITLFSKKLQFKDRYLISQMVSSDNFADVVKFVRKLIGIAFILELIGFLLGIPVFLKMYPNDVKQALWNSLYHAISSFNNAGFDIFNGTTSLIGGLEGTVGSGSVTITGFWYYYFCAYILFLIVIGGISFLVIIEVFGSKKKPKQWKAFTKISLTSTLFLVIFGTLILYLTDGLKAENPMTFFDCLFHSISCRTAGFTTYLQDNISPLGKAVSCFLMLVGGSPLGTAGGIKTTTVFLVVIAIFSYFGGKKVRAFKRTYSNNMVIKATSLIFTAGLILVVGSVCLICFGLDKAYNYQDLGFNTSYELNCIYETFSCFGTTGFFVGIEPYLSVGSKITLCVLMFLGRLGPMTFLSLFQKNLDKEDNSHFKYVEEDFLIG